MGDQIFTDILGANLSGVQSILVEPHGAESVLRFGWRRALEKPVREKHAVSAFGMHGEREREDEAKKSAASAGSEFEPCGYSRKRAFMARKQLRRLSSRW